MDNRNLHILGKCVLIFSIILKCFLNCVDLFGKNQGDHKLTNYQMSLRPWCLICPGTIILVLLIFNRSCILFTLSQDNPSSIELIVCLEGVFLLNWIAQIRFKDEKKTVIKEGYM